MNSEPVIQSEGFPGGSVGKKPACQCRRHKRCHFDPWCRKMPWKRAWQPTAVFLPGESQGERSLVGYGSWGCKESDVTEATKHAYMYINRSQFCFGFNVKSIHALFV